MDMRSLGLRVRAESLAPAEATGLTNSQAGKGLSSISSLSTYFCSSLAYSVSLFPGCLTIGSLDTLETLAYISGRLSVCGTGTSP